MSLKPCVRVSRPRKPGHTLISLRVSVCPEIADTRKDTGPDFLRVSVCPVCPPYRGEARRDTRAATSLPGGAIAIAGRAS